MSKILDIIIPHYREGEAVIKKLLDSIAFQQKVDFDSIGVIIANDGFEVTLSQEFLDSYPFSIKYILHTHQGIGLTRQFGLDYSTADYVMFCDDDDMFNSVYGLFVILTAIKHEGGDGVISPFYEELENKLAIHRNKEIYVHGKVFRRNFLIENNIRWHPNLPFSEDVYFVSLAICLAKKILAVDVIFYSWCNNSKSASRQPQFMGKIYEHVIDSNVYLIEDLMAHNEVEHAHQTFIDFVISSYYAFHRSEWWEGLENKKEDMELCIARVYKRYRDWFNYEDFRITRESPLVPYEFLEKWIDELIERI